MKTRNKWIVTAGMSLMFLTGFTGCTNTEEASKQLQEESGVREGSPETPDKDIGVTDGQETTQEADEAEDWKAREETENGQSAGRKVTLGEGTEHLGGKVQSVTDDGMIFAQTTVRGEGENESMVTLVGEIEAKKISVIFTEDTKVEHWIIQGGGAGIDMRDAALSDLQSGQGVELEGYYEGETFVATRILIEEYN